ncbi:MAG: ATP synthase F0 subunit B [Bacteroidetes bacterium GWF2_33_16]|nr:MAG: ATP synthase F0 subunit B [Bacteroidetes bacterium GWE2_32_14]OFY04754.1 MAG: ATP synthase F0 subunit B [Bacteroidetes bacterium GWF2_33_16]
MELIKPDIGLLIWMMVSFGMVTFLLVKYAWKPILKALKERENTIEKRLLAAKKAKDELAKIEFGNEKITALAKIERENMLKEAKEIKNSIIEEARTEAKIEARKIIEEAKKGVEKEKADAINEIKNQISELSIIIAQKILKHELEHKENQKHLINKLIDDIDLN